MHPPFSRRILAASLAAALLAIPATTLPGTTGHADADAQTHLLRPVRTLPLQDIGVTLAPDTGNAGNNVDASNEGGPQSEAAIAASPANATTLVAGSNDIATVNMNAYSSSDGGKTWARVPLKPHCTGGGGTTSDPGIGANLSGEFFYSYLSYGCRNGEVTVAHSTDGGKTWTPVTAFPDRSGGSDKEQLTVDDNPSSPTKGRIYVAWDENGSVIELIWSDDNGLTWHSPVHVNVGGNPDVIFADPAVGPDGRVYVIWNDYGPRIGSPSLIRFAAASNTPAAGYVPAFTSNSTIATTGINLFNDPSRAFCSRQARPNVPCLPAQPDRGIAADPSLAVDSSGRLYALWTQGKAGSAVTDVELQTSTDGGATWSTPVQVNDDNTPGNFTTGASDFFPWGALDPTTGAYHVSFYSTRLDSTNATTNVYDAVSTNGGASFSANSKVTTAASNESVSNKRRDLNNYGDYEEITVTPAGVEHPVWTDTRDMSTKAEEIFSTSG